MAQKRKIEHEPEFLSSLIVPTGAGTGKMAISSSSGKLEWMENKWFVEKSWAIIGELKKEETFPGTFIKVASGETKNIVGIRYSITEGTKAIIQLKKAGSEVELGSTKEFEAKSTAAEKTGSVSISNNELLTLYVKSVEAAPKNLTATVYIETVVAL